MKRRPNPMIVGLAFAALVSVPAAAQRGSEGGSSHSGGGPSGGSAASGGGTVSSSGSTGGGSGSMSSGGSASSSGGNTGSSFGGSPSGPSGVRSIDSGGRAAATGGGGIAVGRAHSAGSEAYRAGGGSSYVDHTAGRTLGTDPGTRTAGSVGNAPQFSRPREGAATQGTAVPRGSVPTAGGLVNGIGLYGYPYYGYGYYDPLLGGYGYGYRYGSAYGYPYGFYDPMFGGAAVDGFYTDPWYGGSGSLSGSSSAVSSDDATLRLKIKPSNAEVFVDGYFVGPVNDFDGMFQRLHIESGAHRIEVRAPGYETLDIDVRLTSGKTTVYQGELKKIQ